MSVPGLTQTVFDTIDFSTMETEVYSAVQSSFTDDSFVKVDGFNVNFDDSGPSILISFTITVKELASSTQRRRRRRRSISLNLQNVIDTAGDAAGNAAINAGGNVTSNATSTKKYC